MDRFVIRCILTWMDRTLSQVIMARQAPSCPACLHPLAGTHGAFSEVPECLTKNASLKLLCTRIDAAFEKLPRFERERAASGRRDESFVSMSVRQYRYNPGCGTCVVLVASYLSILLDLALLHASPASVLFSLGMMTFAALCLAFSNIHKHIPEYFMCVVKHLAVARLVIKLGSALWDAAG